MAKSTRVTIELPAASYAILQQATLVRRVSSLVPKRPRPATSGSGGNATAETPAAEPGRPAAPDTMLSSGSPEGTGAQWPRIAQRQAGGRPPGKRGHVAWASGSVATCAAFPDTLLCRSWRGAPLVRHLRQATRRFRSPWNQKSGSAHHGSTGPVQSHPCVVA